MLLYIILFLAGVAAGFINTLAGGGSMLTLPVLILLGLPSPVASIGDHLTCSRKQACPPRIPVSLP